MAEPWILSNRRALAFGLLLPALVLVLGLLLAFGPETRFGAWQRGAGYVLGALGLIGIGALVRQMQQPRLAFEDRELLVYLRGGAPIRVPIEIVEGFLLGQAPSMLPGKHEDVEASTVVIRLSDKASEWSHQEVKPALGRWCDGYITLRGTWCEPLSVRLVNRLNRRLAEVVSQAQSEVV